MVVLQLYVIFNKVANYQVFNHFLEQLTMTILNI